MYGDSLGSSERFASISRWGVFLSIIMGSAAGDFTYNADEVGLNPDETLS